MNKNYYRYLIFLLLSISCSKTENNSFESMKLELSKLKDNEATIFVKINNELFYKTESKFAGGANIDEKGLKISLKDQYNGNVIIGLEGDNWFNAKPYRVSFKDGYPIGNNAGSFLIGKISDIVKNAGEGYILYNGFFEIRFINKEGLFLEVEGELKSPFGDAPLKNISGRVLWKTPNLNTNKIEINNFAIPFH